MFGPYVYNIAYHWMGEEWESLLYCIASHPMNRDFYTDYQDAEEFIREFWTELELDLNACDVLEFLNAQGWFIQEVPCPVQRIRTSATTLHYEN